MVFKIRQNQKSTLKTGEMSNRIIISGGGTGGHVFPAIAIASALEERDPGIEILFVGASHKMEMERVPAAGYKIIGLPVTGFQRSLSIKNIVFFYNLFVSMIRAGKIIDQFNPDVVVGVGGYASGPVVRAAASRGVPVLIQEQNSYAGVTNRILAKKAATICVAYEGMERYFPSEKIIITGNPVRQDIIDISGKRKEAESWFNIRKDKKVILVLGGSLGAATINESILGNIDRIKNSGIELIWQTGINGYKAAQEKLGETPEGIYIFDFIARMDLAYAVADLVISRAGAGTISELCLTAKASILVPSPNVAEDHQTRNARALVERNAAVLVKDEDARRELIPLAMEIAGDSKRLGELKKNISAMAYPLSAMHIADEVLKLIKKRESEVR
jgi:UDP-N-acetylglucosamine--N-acetylmuramyl-(pentapeptide) pyrophosphoryl-undecaprenol N-acetylglucosamine transferase